MWLFLIHMFIARRARHAPAFAWTKRPGPYKEIQYYILSARAQSTTKELHHEGNPKGCTQKPAATIRVSMYSIKLYYLNVMLRMIVLKILILKNV